MDKYEVLSKSECVPNIYQLTVYVPKIAKKALPGQFILVMVDKKSERIPFTLADWNANEGTLTIFVQEVGLSTTKMAFMEEGDSFFSIVGPLGKPAYVEKFGRVVLGGGCYGIGAIYSMAKKLKDLGNHITIIIEAKSAFLLFFEEELKSVSDEFIIGTNDGSRGRKAYVHDIIEELIDQEREIDHIKIVGCNVMMMRVAEITKEYKIPTYATVTTIMVDGSGMCGACRLTYDGKTKFACVDGPEFDAHKVDWEELIQVRKIAYIEEEMLSYQNFSPECRSLSKFSPETEEEF